MPKAVGIIFSKDRAMQLEAVLESLYINCYDIENVDFKIIWTYSNSAIKQQYQELAKSYPRIEFISQTDFSRQVLENIAAYEYVLFLVDDNIFIRSFSLSKISESLEKNPDTLGFSLRLGINTNYCYPLRTKQKLPLFVKAGEEILKFDWTTAEYDFNYPLEVSSSVYRVSDIIPLLQAPFTNPNTLEILFDTNKACFAEKRFILCNKYSYTFCNPINKVQAIINNRAGETFYYSPAKLDEMFSEGYRINVNSYQGYMPNACHQEVELQFINKHRHFESSASGPKVSIIMPVYNAAEYLRPAIESILTQTYTNFEFIIIDDGSTDDSLHIINAYLDPRIVLVRNETNLKLVASLNKGLNIARGKYIVRMDADDISLPERVFKQVEFMEQHSDIGVLGTWVELFGDSLGKGCYTNEPDTAKCILLFGCPVAHPAVMIRRDIFTDGLLYSPEYPHAEDYALWVEIAKTHNISNLSEVLLKYRISAHQVSTKYAQTQIESTIQVQIKQLRALGINPTGQELSLHWIISKKQFMPPAFIQAAAQWLNKLKDANAVFRYYPEPAFTDVLRVYWKCVCQNLLMAL